VIGKVLRHQRSALGRQVVRRSYDQPSGLPESFRHKVGVLERSGAYGDIRTCFDEIDHLIGEEKFDADPRMLIHEQVDDGKKKLAADTHITADSDHALRCRTGRCFAFRFVKIGQYGNAALVLMARWPEHLQGRPCSFVGYGTTTGGEDEVDELGCELLKLQAMPVGGYVKFAEIAERLEQGFGLEHFAQARVSMAQLLIQLAWWARALKDARAFSPLQKFA